MNRVILLGNLGDDPKKEEFGDKVKTTISLATSDGFGDNRKTNWHKVELWGKQAELVAEKFSKGERILIEGSVDYHKYEDKYYTTIKATNFEFIEKKLPAMP